MPLFEPVKGCDNCTLKREWPHLRSPRMPVTLPEEPYPIRILVIGEGPGETEDELGIPFMGKTGKFLREHIPDFWKNKLYWSNTVRCRPPANRTPEAHEIFCCSKYLEEDIQEIQPHAILAIGGVALNIFCPGRSITNFHGLVMPSHAISSAPPVWFMATLHPSYVMRGVREKDGVYTNPALAPFVNDLHKFFAAAESFTIRPEIPSPPTVLMPKSFDEAKNLFDKLNYQFTTDYETFKLKPYQPDARLCIASFSDKNTTFAVPVWWPGLIDKWGHDFFIYAMTRGRSWIAHNAAFELAWIKYKTGLDHNFDDTMVLGRLVYHRKGILSLSDQTLINLGLDVKELCRIDTTKLLSYPIEEVMKYCGYDSWSTHLLFNRLWFNLESGTGLTYNRILDTIKSTTDMELLGIPVDLSVTKELSEYVTESCEEAKLAASSLPEVTAFQEKYRRAFVISSNKDVATVLTEFCGAKLPKTDAGNYRTDEDTLRKISSDYGLAGMTLDFREMQKLKSTYIDSILDGSILGTDGKLHGSYTTVLTGTGRASSEDPNMQNFPKRKHKEIRRQIVPPKGCLLLSVDYGQLEARVLAMASGDVNLRREFIAKEDIHSKWLNRVLEVYPAYYESLKVKTNRTEEKEVLKAARDVIKFDFVFASFYGSDQYACAARTGMPIKIAEKILFDEFWVHYAGVRKWIDAQFKKYDETGILSTLTGYKRDEILWGNEPINTPIQGTAAHIVFEAQNAIAKIAKDIDYIHFIPRINIHDDISFFIEDISSSDTDIDLICRETVKPRFDFITVPLQSEAKVGYDWCEMSEIGKWEGEFYD